MAKTATIRVPEEAKQEFAEYARELGLSQSKAFVKLLREYRRKKFFDQLAEDFQRLRSDPIASKEYDEEFAAWDITLNDGMEGF